MDTLTVRDIDNILKQANENFFNKKDEEGKTKLRNGIDKAKDIATTAVGAGASAVGAIATMKPGYAEMKTI